MKKPFYKASEVPEVIRYRYKACLACVGIWQVNSQFGSSTESLPCIIVFIGSAFIIF